jgi:pimeloyl-ACP methyl ester carboxylesterase
MHVLRIVAVAVFVMCLAAVALPLPGGGKAVVAAAASTKPELGPLICGTSSYVSGTFVWTDYAYDDRGANSDESPDRGALPGEAARSGGDATYPDFAAPGNAADLIQLQISVKTEGLQLLAILQTLTAAKITVPILGVAFDTDNNPATGAALLPGGALSWPADGPLGIDKLVVVSSDGAKLWTYTGETWSATESVIAATVDADQNVMKTVVPSNLLDTPEEGIWRAFAVLGIRNSGGGSWLDGSEPIYDLAFVGNEPFVRWQENRQSDILAGLLPASNAAAELDFQKMTDHATALADGKTPGWHTYLHHSALTLSEGVNLPDPDKPWQHEYLGPYQPYMVFIPEELPESDPLTVYLHGADNNHLQSIFVEFPGYVGTARQQSEDLYLIGMFQPDVTLDTSLPVTMQVYPLGRGETLRYEGISEVDVLEVLADAIKRLGIDPDRVSLQGSSMGGVGAYRLGVLYPDLWASILPHVGTGVTYREILFPNLRNVPVLQINGFLDSGQLGPPSEGDADRLDELEYEYHYWLVYDRGHECPAYYRCVFEHASLDFTRNPNPYQVIYTVDPSLFNVNPTWGLDLRYDSAYWVSGIEVSDDSTPGTVNIVSNALPHSTETIERGEVTRNNQVDGQDLCGPNPAFAPGWSTAHPDGESWLERWLVREPGTPEATSNHLQANLTNIGALTLDLNRAGIAAGEECTIDVSTDSAVTITLTGLHRNAGVVLGGTLLRAANAQGQATFELPAGDHELVVTHATFVLSDLTISPDSIKAYAVKDHKIDVSVEVTNSSLVPGTYRVVLQVDGSEKASTNVTLDGGASQTVSFTTKAKTAATYSVRISPLVASGLTIFPREPEAGETVTISATVENTGIVDWSDKVILKFNGEEIDSQDLFLKGGDSETVTFVVTHEGSGTYTIEVGELSGTFKIGYRGFMMSAIVGGIMAVALIAGAVFYGWRSRKVD